MSGRVIKSDLALADIAEQSESLRGQSPRAAMRFLDEVEDAFRLLASMPGLGERLRVENPLLHDLRCLPLTRFLNHIVFYRPAEEGIVVVRVVHGARDLHRVFEIEGDPISIESFTRTPFETAGPRKS